MSFFWKDALFIVFTIYAGVILFSYPAIMKFQSCSSSIPENYEEDILSGIIECSKTTIPPSTPYFLLSCKTDRKFLIPAKQECCLFLRRNSGYPLLRQLQSITSFLRRTGLLFWNRMVGYNDKSMNLGCYHLVKSNNKMSGTGTTPKLEDIKDTLTLLAFLKLGINLLQTCMMMGEIFLDETIRLRISSRLGSQQNEMFPENCYYFWALVSLTAALSVGPSVYMIWALLKDSYSLGSSLRPDALKTKIGFWVVTSLPFLLLNIVVWIILFALTTSTILLVRLLAIGVELLVLMFVGKILKEVAFIMKATNAGRGERRIADRRLRGEISMPSEAELAYAASPPSYWEAMEEEVHLCPSNTGETIVHI